MLEARLGEEGVSSGRLPEEALASPSPAAYPPRPSPAAYPPSEGAVAPQADRADQAGVARQAGRAGQAGGAGGAGAAGAAGLPFRFPPGRTAHVRGYKLNLDPPQLNTRTRPLFYYPNPNPTPALSP